MFWYDILYPVLICYCVFQKTSLIEISLYDGGEYLVVNVCLSLFFCGSLNVR